jgi:dihydrolipoamide dehydrogenase
MYDLAVIGAGWAGFNAALRARELGLKACLIEESYVGGTCLNLGCIPTKTLIQSAKIYSLAKKSSNFGIEISATPVANLARIQERKDKLIQQLRLSMQGLLKGVDFLSGKAQFLSNTELTVGGQLIKAKYFIIATGSRPIELPSLKFDGKKILSSDDILGLKDIPESLLIVGGGVIGCEFASLFLALGTQVTIAEKLPQILPGIDSEIVRRMTTVFKKKGVKVLTNTDALSFNLNDFHHVLVCVGRAGRIEDLDLKKAGINPIKANIPVDDYLKTEADNIYAAGDCTGKVMLAHYAAYQGCIAAENIANIGVPKKADATAIPSCIFTDPEISTVGLSEDEAKSKGLDVWMSKFDFLGSGMARIMDEAEGFIKIISEAKTGQVIGGSIIGPRATELIAVLGLAVSNRLSLDSIRQTIFAHPTLSESIHEAAVTGHAI